MAVSITMEKRIEVVQSFFKYLGIEMRMDHAWEYVCIERILHVTSKNETN